MRRGVVGMHQTKRPSLPVVAMCVVLVAAGVIYEVWAASRRSTPLFAEPAPVAIVAAPMPAPTITPDGPKPEPALKPAPKPLPLTKPQPMPKRARTNSVLHNDLNRYVLNVINTYAGGRYPYLLNADYANYNGVTEDISYQGMVLLRAHPSGNRASHCVGVTFEVFFKAMQQRNQDAGLRTSDFNGLTFEQMQDFMLTWYVANGPKPESNVAAAVARYGLGTQIYLLQNAKAGDFIDVSRENLTGHTAVFIKWVWKDGEIIGLRYWSSQGSANGVSYNTEYFNLPDANGVP